MQNVRGGVSSVVVHCVLPLLGGLVEESPDDRCSRRSHVQQPTELLCPHRLNCATHPHIFTVSFFPQITPTPLTDAARGLVPRCRRRLCTTLAF